MFTIRILIAIFITSKIFSVWENLALFSDDDKNVSNKITSIRMTEKWHKILVLWFV
jgi:hypothetical protein